MKQKCRGADEYDCASKRARRILDNDWKPIKRRMNKRFRKEGRAECLSTYLVRE